ncbi:MAG: glycosyltransferase family 4 protein [Ardenticatenales bacterium]|nr:glycosyltransferase family 4 protein [Ardenticatenales bacterium]
MSSINPLFADKVIGGSTKHLYHVARHLGELGHEVEILSTRRPDSDRPFRWHDNVLVKPLLQFKQPFPQPYDMAAHKMASNIRLIADHLRSADRYYMHDGEILFPPMYHDIPTVISLRDNVYPETMLGSFLFQADALITIADYSRAVAIHAAGQVIPELAERTVAIPNGIDFDHFRPGEPDPAIFDIIPINPAAHTVVLHPHRPETSKGLPQTIAVADLLVHQYGFHDLLVLVPRWFDAAATPEVQAFTDQVLGDIAARGLEAHFHFHDWIPQRLMPDYYNLGDLHLALGHFVEAFGNTVYESLACGTPSIAARVGPYRDLVPDELMDKVHFDDAASAAALATTILRERPAVPEATMAYLHDHFNIDKQLQGYADVILNARKLPPVSYRFTPRDDQTRYRLAPWCYLWGEANIFHDFRAEHVAMPLLAALVRELPDGFRLMDRPELAAGILTGWYEQGYVVPVD